MAKKSSPMSTPTRLMDLELFLETITAVNGNKGLRSIPAEYVLPAIERAITKVTRSDSRRNLTYAAISECYEEVLREEDDREESVQISKSLISTRQDSMRGILKWLMPCIKAKRDLYFAFVVVSDPGQGKSYFANALAEAIKQARPEDQALNVTFVDTRSDRSGEGQSNLLRDLPEGAVAIVDGPFPDDALIAKSTRNYVIFVDRDKVVHTMSTFKGITTFTFDLEKMDAGHITECLDSEYIIEDRSHITNVVQKYLSVGASPKTIMDSIRLSSAAQGQTHRKGSKLAINEHNLEYVIRKAGINASMQLDLDLVRNKLKAEIFGQDEALNSVVDGISLTKYGLRKKGRPLYVGLFVGPTGTGKTELAKVLSEAMYPGIGMVRVNMNQMIADHMSAMLTGAAPGYVGYGKDTPFVAQLKQNPRRIILFDEVEKAAKGVLDNLLNMLDEGSFTTASGEELDLTSCVIILSSNALSDQFHKGKVGFASGGSPEKAINKTNIADKLIESKTFTPEFVNRMDDVVVFEHLGPNEVRKIAEKGLDRIVREMSYRQIKVNMDTELLIAAIQKKANSALGGRDITRLIERVARNVARQVMNNPDLTEVTAEL